MSIGSNFPINGGVGTRTLWRRVRYGGKKGRAARRRLRALERRIAPGVRAMLDRDAARLQWMFDPVWRFARGSK